MKVTVGGRPSPGQTVRLNIVQDADLNMKPTEAAAGSPMGPLHLKAKTTTVVVQSIGKPDEKGALQVDMTYEDRGIGGVKEFLLGSVSHTIARHASVPVLIVK